MDSQYLEIYPLNYAMQQHLLHPNQSTAWLNCILAAKQLPQLSLHCPNPNSTECNPIPAEKKL